MILLRLSTQINGVTVEVEGEANYLEEIRETWESFILTTYQVETGCSPTSYKDLDIHRQNLVKPCDEILEVL